MTENLSAAPRPEPPAIPDRPVFADNRHGETLAAAIAAHLDWLDRTYREPVTLDIATGYFNLPGFALLADRLPRLKAVRLLIGAEPLPPAFAPRRRPGDKIGERFERETLKRALADNERALAEDRDELPFSPATQRAVDALGDLVASGKLEVRRYVRRFLHGKAFLFAGSEGVLCGSSNFTAAGLATNLELNPGHYQPQTTERVRDWFDDLWNDAEDYDLAGFYAKPFEDYPPYLIYLRVLWELYGGELEDEAAAGDGRIRLTTFQNDGLFRARRIRERHHGVLIADGVGLGKSFIAGELMREAIHDRRQRVLLIAPAALRDGMWDRFAHDHGLKFEAMSYEQLAEAPSLGGIGGTDLRFERNEYAMVIVDEAQAFRNPAAKRTAALQRLLLGSPPKKLVLLSATPVNNSLWDLYALLQLFVSHDSQFAARGISSLRDRFRQASAADPFDLKPDLLFDVLDEVTVRRTWHHVRTHYPNDRIRLPNGQEQVVRFPDPRIKRVNYAFRAVLAALFDHLAEALSPPDPNRPPRLTMARYWPSGYRRGSSPEASQVALTELIRSGLLKRFESSVHAFAVTAERMARSHEDFLRGLDAGRILTTAELRDLADIAGDEEWDELLAASRAETVAGYDVDRLREAVAHDLELLRSLAAEAHKLEHHDDPKLAELADTLAAIAAKAAAESVGPEDERRRRKVIVFSYFADTAEWIDEHLRAVVEYDPRLSAYRGRVVTVLGRESYHEVNRQDAVFGFAPESSQAPPAKSDDRFDVLVTTDVLAEGVNLQQCRNLLNYDLPWNPMRLVQRHGRIDRIGSPHDEVFVYCLFPDDRLNDLPNLEGRIRQKLAQAAASIGVESEVIPGGAVGEQVFAESRNEIERLRNEDATLLVLGGEDPHAHSGEEYRQILRKALQSMPEKVKDLPGGAGSGLAGGPERGHFFCGRVGDRVFLRFVPADGREIVGNTLLCLRRITCEVDTPRHMPEDLAAAKFDAWNRARSHIFGEWMIATDPANIQPRVRPYFRKAIEFLRTHPPAAIEQQRAQAAVDALNAPWTGRHEHLLKEVFDPDEPSEQPSLTAARLVEKVEELGMRPAERPKPLPPIREDDVHLVCWMAVDAVSPVVS